MYTKPHSEYGPMSQRIRNLADSSVTGSGRDPQFYRALFGLSILRNMPSNVVELNLQPI